MDARAEGHRVESSRVRSSPAAQQLKHLAFVTARKDGAGPSLRFAVSGRRGLRACLGSEASKPTNHPGRLFLGSPTPKRLAARRLHRITREPCRRKGFQCARWSREGIITSLHARPLVCKVCRLGAGATRSTYVLRTRHIGRCRSYGPTRSASPGNELMMMRAVVKSLMCAYYVQGLVDRACSRFAAQRNGFHFG